MNTFTHNPTNRAPGGALLRRCLPALSAALLGLVASATSLVAQAGTCSVTTPGAATCVIPAGVPSVNVVATGGGGGGSTGATGTPSGGAGGVVTQTLTGVGGTTLSLFVGGGGITMSGGGSGGGASSVNAGTASQIIAGGGGGVGTCGGSGGNGNGGLGGCANGAAGGSGGVGGSGGNGGFSVGGAGGSGNGGSGGNGGGGGTGGSGSGGGTGGSGVGAGGGFGGGGGGAGGGQNGGGGGGGGGGSTGGTITVGSNGGTASSNGGDGSIVITWTDPVADPAAPAAPIPPLASGPGIPNVGSQLTVLDMSGGNGPSMTTCLVNALKQMFGAEATYMGQSVNGVVRISQAGQVISFYPLAASTSTAQGIGIALKGDGTLSVGTSCGSFTVVPAVANVPELGSALTAMGLNVQIGAQGVITTTVNGTLYVVRPDYFVTQAAATGKATIAFGSDGVLRFTDSAGNVQILRAAFLDPSGLQSFMGAALGGTLTIQADASGVFTLINGQQLLLAPEMQLSPAGLNAANWVNDKANHYLYRIGASYQGLSAVSR